MHIVSLTFSLFVLNVCVCVCVCVSPAHVSLAKNEWEGWRNRGLEQLSWKGHQVEAPFPMLCKTWSFHLWNGAHGRTSSPGSVGKRWALPAIAFILHISTSPSYLPEGHFPKIFLQNWEQTVHLNSKQFSNHILGAHQVSFHDLN